jgi:hypothetical protein
MRMLVEAVSDYASPAVKMSVEALRFLIEAVNVIFEVL